VSTREAAAPTRPADRVSLGERGFWWLFANAITLGLVLSADRFTFEWLTGDTLGAPDWASGVVLFALGLPVCLFVLPAGALADRSDRRRMLVVTQLAAALVLAAAALLTASGAMNVPMAIVTAALFGTTMAFAQPVRSSLVPALVPASERMRAIILVTMGVNVAMIVGPLLAGGLVQTHGVAWAFALQAALFTVGLVMALNVHPPPPPPRVDGSRLRTEVGDGLTFVWRHHTLRALFFLLTVGGLVMMGAAVGLLPKIARDEFGRDAGAAAGLFALMGAGLVVTSIILMRVRHRLHRRGLLFMLTMVTGTTNGIIQGFVGSFLALQILLFLWGMSGGIYLNLNQTLIQELTPQDRMGRVMSLNTLVNAGLIPIGALASSALAGVVGPQPALSIISAIGLVCVLLTLAVSRDLRAQP
jgi:MFS family permease